MPLGRLIDDCDHFVESFRFRRADGLGRRRRLYSASLTLVVDRLAALAGQKLPFTSDFFLEEVLRISMRRSLQRDSRTLLPTTSGA